MTKEQITNVFNVEKSRTMQASRIFAIKAKEDGVTEFSKEVCKTLRAWFKKEVTLLDPYWETKSGNDALCHGLKNLATGKVKFEGNSTDSTDSEGNEGNSADSTDSEGNEGNSTDSTGSEGNEGNSTDSTDSEDSEDSEDNAIHHEKEELITKLVERNLPVYLYGPAGTGKTSVCISIAKKLGLDFYFSASVTQEHKITGFVDANGRYHDTPFSRAFTYGGVFLIDEMDNSAPEVLTLLNAAIAQRMFVVPGLGVIKAHKDFHIIAAGNTLGTGADSEYVSRVQLDSATLNRFIPVPFDYSPAIENAIAKDIDLVNFVHELREAISESGISYVISYRNISYFNEIKEVLSEPEALKIAFAGYMDKDNLSMVASNLMSNNKYSKMLENAVNN